MKLMIDIVGWIGAGLLLTAFFMVSRGQMKGKSLSYQVLNAFGGTFLGVNSLYYQAYPAVGINVIWVAISLLVLGKAATKKLATARKESRC